MVVNKERFARVAHSVMTRMYHICSAEQRGNIKNLHLRISCALSLSISRKFGHKGVMLDAFSSSASQATIRYLDGDMHILVAGDYVVCAVTGQKIPLEALRYWSVDRQEAYSDAAAALQAEQAARKSAS